MKAFNMITKIVVALAAVAGAVFVIATYGDKIVAWAKNLLHTCHCKKAECTCDDEDIDQEDKIIILRDGAIRVPADEAPEAPAEEPAAAEEAPEAPAEEADEAVVADDTDFEA